MRPSIRLLANVKPAKYLEPFTPTGLTGLATHPSPRPTLIYLYSNTLHKLRAFPESSVYRQSTEAVTRQRLEIVETTKPPGFDAWLERAKKTVAAEPERFATLRRADGSFAAMQHDDGNSAPLGQEWDGEGVDPPTEGPHRSAREEANWNRAIAETSTPKMNESDFHEPSMSWENEPALEAAQVSDIEQKIGAGLIEEIIMVAEGELQLVDDMYKSKAWEELEEKPSPGQWNYFERSNHETA